MLESINVTERLHWPEVEKSKNSVLSSMEKPVSLSQVHLEKLSPSVLKDLFTTGTSSYNVLLQMERKERLSPRHSARGRPTMSLKCASMFHKRHSPHMAAPATREGLGNTVQSKSLSNLPKAARNFTVLGNSVGLSPRPLPCPRKTCTPNSPWTKLPLLYRPSQKIENAKKICILSAIKPSNVEKEKLKFLKSGFTYNPQFEYSNPVSPLVLERHSSASNRFLTQAVRIMDVALEKYSSYEKFELATGGNLLSKSRIWYNVRKYMEKEGCVGEIVVNVTDDLLSRASMMVVNGRPTLTINTSSAREHWLEGMLRHEIGTHYFRGINNSHQPWNSSVDRKRHSLKPMNPTEEGLASIHSVLFRKDPTLWRAALLYYTVYQASRMSFTQLFHSLGRFVHDPNTRWDYCVRAKRGQTDTAQPGCFSKDQVYLDGVLKILRHRDKIDFPMLVALGKVSFEDVDRLKGLAQMEKVRIPHFLQDRAAYAQQLDKIMEVNQLTDEELRIII